MNDGSSSYLVRSLRSEWNLFWESLLSTEENTNDEKTHETTDPFVTGKLEVLSLAQVRELTRALSEDRKKINQQIEKLHKEIELNAAKLEGLQLVGASDEGALKRIAELTDIGQQMSEALENLDQKIRSVHLREEEINKQNSEI